MENKIAELTYKGLGLLGIKINNQLNFGEKQKIKKFKVLHCSDLR